MYNIIGGLLVVTLLSRPAAFKLNLMAYEVTKPERKIIATLIKKETGKEKIKYRVNSNGETDVNKKMDDVITSIDDNNRALTKLLKEKNSVVGKIQTVMDLKAHTKTRMTDAQINKFSGFTSYVGIEGGILQDRLKKIDDKKNLINTKNEILHTNTNYSLVFTELNEIVTYQRDAIASLNRLIDAGNTTLQAL